MLKRKITYEDFFTGETVTDEFYFNLTRTELTEMELGSEKGMERYLKEIAAEQDPEKIYYLLKDIVLKSYGEREGSKFRKSKEISEEFAGTAAFDALMAEFFSVEDDGKTGANAAAEFINAITPKINK